MGKESSGTPVPGKDEQEKILEEEEGRLGGRGPLRAFSQLCPWKLLRAPSPLQLHLTDAGSSPLSLSGFKQQAHWKYPIHHESIVRKMPVLPKMN